MTSQDGRFRDAGERRRDARARQRDVWSDAFAPPRESLAHVEAILDSVLARVGGGRAPAMLRLVSEWDSIAGAEWATKTKPAALDGGTLIIEVPDGGAASRLKYEKRALLARIAAALGPGVVGDLKVRVRRGRDS